MTASQYWDEDVFLAVSYREAHNMKEEALNQNAWWQGWYIYEAVRSSLTATLPWFKKPEKYPDKPHRVTPLTEDEKKMQSEIERKKAIAQLTAWKHAWDSKNGR